MGYRERYEEWIRRLPQDDPMRAELLAIEGNDTEIKDRFYKEIEFGTAGLRGICGAGTNRMNTLTVGRATQGIANYILSSGENPARGFAIAYDCRYHSKEFAELAAQILAGNGITVYLFPSLRPTPELSFTIRSFAALGGINLTASHNPKEYNGYLSRCPLRTRSMREKCACWARRWTWLIWIMSCPCGRERTRSWI